MKHVLLASFATAVVLVCVAVPASAGTDFCALAKPVAGSLIKDPTPVKEYKNQGGVALFCSYGKSEDGVAITRSPGKSKASFQADQASRRAKSQSGVGVPAFLSSAPGQSFLTLYFLKGTTELSVGAKAPVAKLVQAAKALLKIG